MSKISIRPLEVHDFSNGFLEALDSLKATNLSYKEAEDIFRKIASYPNQLVFVALIDSKVVGTATLLIEQKFIHGGARVAHIEDVSVRKSLQHTGVGKTLILHLLEFAKKKGCYKTILSCLPDVKPFYEKLGFKPHLEGMRFDHLDTTGKSSSN